MSETSKFLDVTLDFLREAGKIAVDYQEHLVATLKPDKSIVTQADLEISKLFRVKIDSYIKQGNHDILDEEDLQSVPDFFKNRKEYVWVIDPIDGTNTYYHGFPLWAIAVSLYRNFKPLMGAIYMPITGDLIYSDGVKSFHRKNAFGDGERTVTLAAGEPAPLGKNIILSRRCCDTTRRDYAVLDLYSGYVMSIYTLTNRSLGQFFRNSSKFWDVAASIAIARTMGICFRNLENDRDFEAIDPDAVELDWSLRGVYLMCNPLFYERLKNDNLLVKQ
ncbi:MAG: inositol monophosphatase family protein [Rickettsiales bacterium]|jgi:fructose-1,6-bisphosphatase/inositol monophosphatase family enzyme|nr:inositol monophosphatase family protein [Rickettsiales bacterium]